MPSDTPPESPAQLAERLDGYIQRSQSEGLSGEELSRFFNQDAPTISRMLRAADFALAETHALRQDIADLTANRNAYARDLRHNKEEIGKLHSAIAKRESERDALRDRLLVMVDKLNGATHEGRAALVRENDALRLRAEELTEAMANNLDNGSKDRAEAWDAVCELVTELDPAWAMRSEGTGIECMLAWIKRLAALAPSTQAAKEKECEPSSNAERRCTQDCHEWMPGKGTHAPGCAQPPAETAVDKIRTSCPDGLYWTRHEMMLRDAILNLAERQALSEPSRSPQGYPDPRPQR